MSVNEVTITKSNGVVITKPFPPLEVIIDALVDSGRFDCETVCDFVSLIYAIAAKYQPDQKKRGEIIPFSDLSIAGGMQ